MRICGLQKTTLLDYPGNLACIIFTEGCNYRCSFCQNSELLNPNNKIIETYEIMRFLRKRKGVLDGIVISGGEPTISPGLKDFIKEVKRLRLKVKLDTNGTNPKLLKELIDEGLVDYVAMDIKHTFKQYEKIINILKYDPSNIIESIKILRDSKIDYEFRTTIVREFHKLEDIEEMILYIGDSKYYIQNFEDSENVLKKGLHGFTKDELKEMKNKLEGKYPNVHFRNLE